MNHYSLIQAAAAMIRCMRKDPTRRHLARDYAFTARRVIGAIELRRAVA
jgi:hypothetical protein